MDDVVVSSETILPEQHALWIHTSGCAHNFADGEYMKVCVMVEGVTDRVSLLIMGIRLLKTECRQSCGIWLCSFVKIGY